MWNDNPRGIPRSALYAYHYVEWKFAMYPTMWYDILRCIPLCGMISGCISLCGMIFRVVSNSVEWDISVISHCVEWYSALYPTMWYNILWWIPLCRYFGLYPTVWNDIPRCIQLCGMRYQCYIPLCGMIFQVVSLCVECKSVLYSTMWNDIQRCISPCGMIFPVVAHYVEWYSAIPQWEKVSKFEWSTNVQIIDFPLTYPFR